MFKYFSLPRQALPAMLIIFGAACSDKPIESMSKNTNLKKSTIIDRGMVVSRDTPTVLPELSYVLPIKESFNGTVSLEAIQREFDVFSWESFIALNWPALPNGDPDTAAVIGQDNDAMTVWQNYKESRDIFLPGGAAPAAWDEAVLPPLECQAESDKPVLVQVGKTPNVLDESGEPFRTGPLIDQNGQYTRYEILTNEVMFDYIVSNTLYSKQGQQAFGAAANFPSSVVPKGIDQTKKIVAGELGDHDKVSTQGSIMIKAAWKVMGENDNTNVFYVSDAYVYDNPSEFAGVAPACELQSVGLVGFHIGTKTAGSPQWAWSTFEHVNNVPTQGQAASKARYNYYRANCGGDCAEVNVPPARPWDPAMAYTQPSQIKRVIPIDAATQAVNQQYHDALRAVDANSVWANYELISTQWPTNANSVTDPTGAPAPSFLANTTLETYIQGRVHQTSSSCIQCHNNAGMTDGHFSDFTYLLQRAE